VIVAEARAGGISEAAIEAAAARIGVVLVDGRLTLPNGNGGDMNGHRSAPITESATTDDRAAMRSARMWIRKTLADGPRPEAEVVRRLTEMGLAHLAVWGGRTAWRALSAGTMVVAWVGNERRMRFGTPPRTLPRSSLILLQSLTTSIPPIGDSDRVVE